MAERGETLRKLIDLGGSIVVAVPPPFLKGQHLAAGDQVRVFYDGPIVVIRPVPSEESE